MIENIAQRISLSDGNKMPGYGFGCYKIKGEELLMALATAWQAGYRLYDTAVFYDNEETVGQGLKGRPLAEYFLISKIWPTDFGNPVKTLDASLKKLGRDYLDAYLLHWPGTNQKLRLATYEALLREREKGKIRTLGVSNFLEKHLEEIKANFGAYPMINQIEIHPYHQEKDLCEYCQKRQITVMAWSPLGRGIELKDPQINELAKTLGKTASQVILRWQIQGDKVAIPKSAHAERIIANAQVFDFALDRAQMAVLDSLNRANGRTGADPDTFAG